MKIRDAKRSDLPFLRKMLFEAFHWNPDQERPQFQVFIENPEFSRLLEDWGRDGDEALIAEISSMPIGAAWYRQWSQDDHTYGFVDTRTPELGIAIESNQRSTGVGKALLYALLNRAHANGIGAISLSVEPNNFAYNLYKSRGFVKVGESGTSWTMKLTFEAATNRNPT